MFTVYRYYNRINDNSYVGVTCNLTLRRRSHLRGTDPTSLLYLAINKYGEDAFGFEILAKAPDRDSALLLEQSYIEQFDSFRNGYNRTKDGDGTFGLSGEDAPGAKITKKVAQSIIDDPCSLKEAVVKYNTTITNVSLIRCGKTWKALDRSDAPSYGTHHKLTSDIVKQIIMDPCSNRDASIKYGTSDMQVSSIRNNKTWKHISRDNAPEYHRPRRKN